MGSKTLLDFKSKLFQENEKTDWKMLHGLPFASANALEKILDGLCQVAMGVSHVSVFVLLSWACVKKYTSPGPCKTNRKTHAMSD